MSYDKSILRISPAVEVAYDLSLVAALLRASTINASDSVCHGYGASFRAKLLDDSAPEKWKDKVTLREMFCDKSLAAPRTLQQEKTAQKTPEDSLWNLRHVPITPAVAQRTNFVRHDSNLWDIPKRVALMLRRGCRNKEEYTDLMRLVAGSSSGQDLLQFFVDSKISSIHAVESIAGPRDVEDDVKDADTEIQQALYPYSEVLVSHVRLICNEWRPRLMSTHFALLLDSLLRLHAFMEVRHLAKMNAAVVSMLETAHRSGVAPSVADVKQRMMPSMVEVGDDLGSDVRQLANSYERSLRFMAYLDAESVDVAAHLSTFASLTKWLASVSKHSDKKFNAAFARMEADAESGELDRAIKSSSRINNFSEFMSYSISQRQMNTGRDGQYDQSYWASKSGAYKAARWNIAVSPVGSILFAGLAAKQLATCSFSDIKAELQRSGFVLGSLGESQLHAHLKGLGLAIDSPDGAGGFLVSNPFHIN